MIISDLNAVPLSGQTLSINWNYGSLFCRVTPEVVDADHPPTMPQFGAGLEFFTNFNSFPPFASGTGYLFDGGGIHVTETLPLGSAVSSGGEIIVGFMPFLTDPLDFWGVHMDVTMPDLPGANITHADLSFYGPFALIDIPVSPQSESAGEPVLSPDSGSSLALTIVAVALVAIARKSNV